VQKVTDTTAAGFSKLSSDLLAIRGETGASMESIAGAAAGAGRMGIDPTEIAGYTETILKMSSAWGMSADAASESIGKIGSVVKPAEMTWTEFGNRMGSTINDLADSMATSEESIVTGMKKVSAQMAMLKPSPDQLSEWAALIGQLQAFGMTAETSGESLKDALNYMMRDDKSGISSMLDMDATEFQEAIREDAIGIVQELAVAISELPIEEQGQALQKFGATGGQMMGMLVGKVDPVTKEIEGLDAALATGASAWENASSLNEAYAKSQETLNAQIDIFKGKISVAATSIGAVLLPYLTQMMKGVNDITQALIGLGPQGWQLLTGGAYELYEGLEKLDNKVGEVLSGGTETRGLVGSFVGDVTGALSDGLKSAEGQIKIGDEWVKDMADVQAARDAGKLTAQEYLSGLKEVSSAGMKGPTTGLMDSLQEFATTGKLTTDQYKKSLSSVSEIYSQVGDAAADMIGPLTEGFENGTVSAEDYISILEDMTTVSEELGDGADEALEPLTQAFEDGTVSAEEYKNIMDDVANAVTSLGSDFDSIAGPIQDAFSQGEISATQYQDAINSISDVHAQLGESTEYVIGPITEMFESGEISADEYITALDGVLSGSKEFGTEFT
ncbi:MAG TPA: phage tail tape measure protein, partial [Methanothrix sp.]|nr:phage tail tape measure protein [Methanothrix sp.]